MLIQVWQRVKLHESTAKFYEDWSIQFTEEQIESLYKDIFSIKSVPNWFINEKSEFILVSSKVEFPFVLSDFKILPVSLPSPKQYNLFS